MRLYMSSQDKSKPSDIPEVRFVIVSLRFLILSADNLFEGLSSCVGKLHRAG